MIIYYQFGREKSLQLSELTLNPCFYIYIPQ